MRRPMYYRLDGHVAVPTDDPPHPWPSHETRRVGSEDIDADTYVSTVFLVLDHGWEGPPLVFESMIFGGPYTEECWRYSTWDEAAAGHARIVAALRAGRDPDGEPK